MALKNLIMGTVRDLKWLAIMGFCVGKMHLAHHPWIVAVNVWSSPVMKADGVLMVFLGKAALRARVADVLVDGMEASPYRD